MPLFLGPQDGRAARPDRSLMVHPCVHPLCVLPGLFAQCVPKYPSLTFRGSSPGAYIAHFRAQLEDLREHIARISAELEHLRDTSAG